MKKELTLQKMGEKSATRFQELGFDLEVEIFSISDIQRDTISVLLSEARPMSTANLRNELIKWTAVSQDDNFMKELFQKFNVKEGTTIDRDEVEEILEKNPRKLNQLVPILKKLGIRVPSYEGLETELRSLENKAFILKLEEPEKNAKYLWQLNPLFIRAYLKAKQRIALELAKAKEKDAQNVKRPFQKIQEQAFENSHPAQILLFFGIR